MRSLTPATCLGVVLAVVALPAPGDGLRDSFRFRDVTTEVGLLPEAAGIRGHSAGWGDADNDGWPDLFVGTFHTDGSQPCLLFRSERGRFRLDTSPAPRLSTRANSALFVDLDNDGDLDLYVAGMPAAEGSRLALKEGRRLAGCSLLRNDGRGQFTNISSGNGACPPAFGGRSATATDFDGDGRLDLLVGEDPLPGYNGSSTRSSRLFRNLGGLQFEDATRAARLPDGVPGYGAAAADVNQDGWPDLFLAANDGGNRLFVNDGHGHFRTAEGPGARFQFPGAGGENMVCGAAFGDVNRDGRLDLLLGQHYSTPWREPIPNRLFLNRGERDGNPAFEDITGAAGLPPLPMKAPHVEIQDFDNDGWPDLYASLVIFAGNRPFPLLCRHRGLKNGLPRFETDALGANDFPTPADREIRSSTRFSEKVLLERKVFYSAPGPSGDYDRDGRLDLFLPSWWAEAPSLLLRNETPGGHWLDVRVDGGHARHGRGLNRQGIGTRVAVYAAGRAGEAAALVGVQEIAVGFGYTSGHAASAHFGLGPADRCDIVLTLPHGLGTHTARHVRGDRVLLLTPGQ